MSVKFYEDNHITLYNSDCRNMTDLADETVQCVVTSPPYWGLRKYSGVADLVWGGRVDCEHRWGETIPHPMEKSGKHGPASILTKTKTADAQHEVRKESNMGNFCSLCGAWKGSYGLEPTPEMYIEHTIEILREIRRVLRKDGVVFWNIGDSYAGSGGAHKEEHANPGISDSFNRQGVPHYGELGMPERYLAPKGLKPKDLCLIPFRVAIAAQEDGWWVRSIIIWSKPNPMPESVTDRPTESHEYILMLTKSKKYYWDADAVREPHKPETIERYQYGYKESERDKLGHSHHGKGYQRNDGSPIELNAGRNIRTVWTFPTQPFPEAHFAVFPEKLPETCIKAATPEVGCCSKCGAPWERIVDVSGGTIGESWHDHSADIEKGNSQSKDGIPLATFKTRKMKEQAYKRESRGWQPTCNCNADKVASLVLDPFLGAGTTAWVAKRLNRRCVGYELSSEYCELAVKRNRQQVLL